MQPNRTVSYEEISTLGDFKAEKPSSHLLKNFWAALCVFDPVVYDSTSIWNTIFIELWFLTEKDFGRVFLARRDFLIGRSTFYASKRSAVSSTFSHIRCQPSLSDKRE